MSEKGMLNTRGNVYARPKDDIAGANVEFLFYRF